MGDGAAWNYISMQQAIADSGLEEKDVKNDRTGLIMGSGGISTRTLVAAADTTREKGPKRVGPFAVLPSCPAPIPHPCHALRHSRRELFHFISLRHLGPLHRQCR